MRLRNVFSLIFLLGLPLVARAETDPNKGLGIYLSQHGYCAVRVDNSGLNTEIIQAKINGKGVSLIIDTGCPRTSLTARYAKHLKLDVHDTGQQNFGVGGMITGDDGIALINSFKLNDIDINRTNTIIVLPKSAYAREDGF
jgi:hypothetical protein